MQKPVALEGAGVYYAASFVEAQLCAGEEVIVTRGGNSAGFSYNNGIWKGQHTFESA